MTIRNRDIKQAYISASEYDGMESEGVELLDLAFNILRDYGIITREDYFKVMDIKEKIEQ